MARLRQNAVSPKLEALSTAVTKWTEDAPPLRSLPGVILVCG